MKEKNKIRKLRNRFNGEIYWTDSDWLIREIDGKEFIFICKVYPDNLNRTPTNIKLMSKDNLEYVK